jgi:5-(carboxyamino)imidazole ribonucleotide mutase
MSVGGVAKPLVGVVMGSISDWSIMEFCAQTLSEFGISHEAKIVSAHRMPNEMAEYASTAQARGVRVIIAGAGGAAHLPGMIAAQTLVPVLGVPIPSTVLQGTDSLLSIVQMPAGVPVATFAIGKPGAINAALFAAAILAPSDAGILARLDARRVKSHDDAVASQSQLSSPPQQRT